MPAKLAHSFYDEGLFTSNIESALKMSDLFYCIIVSLLQFIVARRPLPLHSILIYFSFSHLASASYRPSSSSSAYHSPMLDIGLSNCAPLGSIILMHACVKSLKCLQLAEPYGVNCGITTPWADDCLKRSLNYSLYHRLPVSENPVKISPAIQDYPKQTC